ncbi:hypothetical protein L484_007328 [Morus notabilis]|uniref:Uncharacterized protein n=1 Tax=Morus notabilis TaxID=981085 RepID=W9RQ23_9ROSA|nr:hypothetical protein L484_007328 [Morus notabilis]
MALEFMNKGLSHKHITFQLKLIFNPHNPEEPVGEIPTEDDFAQELEALLQHLPAQLQGSA